MAVNARFSYSKLGHRKKQFERNRDNPSNLDKLLDRPCQIHGTHGKPANHTNRNCWVFKQADKLNTEHTGKGLPCEDEDEPRLPNIGGRRNFL